MQAYTYILYSCQITSMKISFKLKILFFKYIIIRDGIVCVRDGFYLLYNKLSVTDFSG